MGRHRPRTEAADEEIVVEKEQPSACFDTGLNTLLTYEGVGTVVVTGATTSGCVRPTVVDACSHGYRPIVPVVCVGDRADDLHEATLVDIGSEYADLLDRREVEQHIEDGADEG